MIKKENRINQIFVKILLKFNQLQIVCNHKKYLIFKKVCVYKLIKTKIFFRKNLFLPALLRKKKMHWISARGNTAEGWKKDVQ